MLTVLEVLYELGPPVQVVRCSFSELAQPRHLVEDGDIAMAEERQRVVRFGLKNETS